MPLSINPDEASNPSLAPLSAQDLVAIRDHLASFQHPDFSNPWVYPIRRQQTRVFTREEIEQSSIKNRTYSAWGYDDYAQDWKAASGTRRVFCIKASNCNCPSCLPKPQSLMPLVENDVFKINGSPVSHICYLTTGGSTVFIVMRNERGQYFFQAMITAQLSGEQLREICKAIIGKWEVEIVSLGILRTDELKFISEDVAPCFVREAPRILKVIDY